MRKKSFNKYSFQSKKEKPKKKHILIEIVIYMVEIAIVIGLAYALIQYGVMKTTMVGDSMAQTLYNEDEVLINRLIYKINDPQRFDVVAYHQNSSEHSYTTIKRIIGLPGERIRIEEGMVYINDELLSEKTNVEVMNTGGLASEEIVLEENEYFLLGDNRNNSQDSRFSNVGTIVFDDMIGKVWVRLEPLNFIKSLNLAEVDILEEGK